MSTTQNTATMTARYLYLYTTATGLNVEQAVTAIDLCLSQGITLEQIAEELKFARAYALSKNA